MTMMKNAHWVRKITNLKRSKDEYITNVSSTITATVKGGDGKDHALTILASAEDAWTKVGGNWMVKRSKLLKMNALMDGKAAGAK
jgi:hypothetical protein